MTMRPQRLRGVSLFTPFSLVLGLLVLIAGFSLKRFIYGLGAWQRALPSWGLWVTWDLIGSALGCGGFAMATSSMDSIKDATIH
jgi:Ni/Fe-hydrogenase subunit HybB-like protein